MLNIRKRGQPKRQIFLAQEFRCYDNSYLIYHRMLSRISISLVKYRHYRLFVIYKTRPAKITSASKMHKGNIV